MLLPARLDLGYDYGAEGGRSWNTTVIERANGHEDPNQNWEDWRGSWQLGQRNVTKARLDYLVNFLAAARGRAHHFRYRDWNDYEASQELATFVDATSVQLTKTYGAGLNPYVCTVDLPVADTVAVQVSEDAGASWVDLAEGADYTLDDSTGLITLSGALDPETDLVRWSGEFDVRCRFDVERVPAVFLAFERQQRIYELGSLTVSEVRADA